MPKTKLSGRRLRNFWQRHIDIGLIFAEKTAIFDAADGDNRMLSHQRNTSLVSENFHIENVGCLLLHFCSDRCAEHYKPKTIEIDRIFAEKNAVNDAVDSERWMFSSQQALAKNLNQQTRVAF